MQYLCVPGKKLKPWALSKDQALFDINCLQSYILTMALEGSKQLR